MSPRNKCSAVFYALKNREFRKPKRSRNNEKVVLFFPAVSITIILVFLNILVLGGSLNYSHPFGAIIYFITIALLFASAILMAKTNGGVVCSVYLSAFA